MRDRSRRRFTKLLPRLTSAGVGTLGLLVVGVMHAGEVVAPRLHLRRAR